MTRLIDHVSIVDFCLTGFGSGVSAVDAVCVDDAVDALVTSSRASLGLRLGMAISCDNRVDCDPTQRNWGTEFILEMLGDDGSTIEESLVFARYRYQGEALWDTDIVGEPKHLHAHIGDDFFELVNVAADKGRALRVKARLMGYARVTAVSNLTLPRVFPATISAGDTEIGYEIISVVESEGGHNSKCVEGDFFLEGIYSIDNVTYHDARLCVAVSADKHSAQLVSGILSLGGERIELAPFHSSFIRPKRSRKPFVLGAPRIILPFAVNSESTNETYLHADGLPFAFRISGARITSQGLLLDYAGILYLPYQGIHKPETVLASNDVFYSTLHGDDKHGSLLLTEGAMNTSVEVPGGESAAYAYPEGLVSWDPFDISIVNGRIDSLSLMEIRNLQFSLEQSSKCGSLNCGGIPQSTHNIHGDGFLDGLGAVLGELNVQNNSLVHWGGHEGTSGSAFSRTDDLNAGSAVTLSLPGYQFLDVDDNGLDAQLNGHLIRGTSSSSPLPVVGLQLYPLGSDDAVEGNYWPTGITVGPEWYSRRDGGALPEVGSGRNLEGSAIGINNGSDAPYAFDVSKGAKYVLRNAGLTGVFNIAGYELDNPIGFYGYDMRFDRFAFTVVDNVLDEYSWIDGLLRLPDRNDVLLSQQEDENPLAGAAGFDVEFVSLALDCRGRFNGGNVVLGEGALPKAYAWNAETDIYHMGFDTAGSSAIGQCSSDPQWVTLDQTFDMHALNEPLKAVSVQWSPDGAIGASNLLTNQDYVLDGQENYAGFGVSVNQGRLETLLHAEGQPDALYGVAKLDGARVATYFWQAPVVDIRLRNTAHGADRSVVIGAGLIDSEDALKNAEFNLPDNPQFDVTAHRQWGDNFGFSLPTYYTSGDSTTAPAFIGRYQQTDLLVMQAGAGIDYIRPDDSMLSFGLSADIAKVSELPMSLDLSSSESIRRLGEFIQSAGIANVNLGAVLTPLQTRLAALERQSGAALESAMEVRYCL